MKYVVFAFTAVLETVIGVLMWRPGSHQMLLAPGVEPLRWWLGRWRSYRTFNRSVRVVPAYRQFLREQGFDPSFPVRGDRRAWFSSIPEMDKDSYIRRFSIPQRCQHGRLPAKGVIVDESSGSSGTPTSWVRGPAERRATRELMQVAFWRSSKEFTKPPFIINAFSLGAWATGMNVSASLADMGVLKSVGPDANKIIATMKEFGSGFTYIITSYPPFLKSLLDDDRLDWREYDVMCVYGGEGISESMRSHILRKATSVLGSYGASDLEINLAIESEFTIALRQAVMSNSELAADITKMGEYGVIPSISQFNPFSYIIDVNDQGELLVTITRRSNINPRIRYNIHDRGHVLRMRELLPVLHRHGLDEVVSKKLLDLPVLFHYGRSDLSVDYNGAVLAPDTVRDVLNSDPRLLEVIHSHRLVSFEDEQGDRHLHLALQLCPEQHIDDPAQVARQIIAALRERNGDFHNAILTSVQKTLPTVGFYAHRTGVFAADAGKLKNDYVAILDADQAAQAGMSHDVTVER